MAYRLRSARLSDATLVSQIDDYVGELETELAGIFGFTLDTNITASPFSCDNSGRLTKQLITQRAAANINDPEFPGQVGLHIYNTTNDAEIVIGMGSYDVDEGGSGTKEILFGIGEQGTGQFESIRFALIQDTDADLHPYWNIYGSTVAASKQGLVPVGSGNAGEYLCGIGTFRTPGVEPANALIDDARSTAGGTTIFSSGASDNVIYWSDEQYDDDGLHTADDDEIVIATAGKYYACAWFYSTPGTFSGAGYVSLAIWRDRGGADTEIGRMRLPLESADAFSHIQVDAYDDCQVGDRLWVSIQWNDTTSFSHEFWTIDGGNSFAVTRVA